MEYGTTPTAYEPYKEQTLTLQTPNGLPGLKVEENGNYTDKNGQQWITDEIDLARGSMCRGLENTHVLETKTYSNLLKMKA